MMKNRIVYILLFLPLFSMSQVGDDGWNHRELDEYDIHLEVARETIKLLPGFSTANQTSFRAYINPDLPMNGGEPVTDGEFNMNYTRTYVPLQNNASSTIPEHDGLDYANWSETISYFDGLGRNIQQVAVKASAAGTDVIQSIVYDDLGRQKQEYLPYAITQGGSNGPGGYRSGPISEQETFYSIYNPGDQQHAYGEKDFDNSPLNRVKVQRAPGNTWRSGQGFDVEYEYNTNTENYEAYLLTVNASNHLVRNGHYSAGKLSKTKTTDENDGQTIEYKDILGRVVCKQVYDGSAWMKTYYAYDDFGLLRYVIPPLAYTNLSNGTYPDTTAWIKNLCYYYEYDDRQRMKLKRMPGADAVYMVYNQLDQLVLTQDGNLRADTSWLFTKYDVFNRPVMTGIYKHTAPKTQAQMQAVVDAESDLFEEVDLSFTQGYSNDAYPDITTADCQIHSVMYYDNYAYIDQAVFNDSYDFVSGELSFMYGKTNSVKGMLTASKTRILPNDDISIPGGLEYLIAANYYDKYGRNIQTIADNHLGGKDIISHQINFTGDVLLSKENHNNGTNGIILTRKYTYDNGKRLKETQYEINEDNNWITLNEQYYDELGRVKRKLLHQSNGSAQQTVNYAYNIRGWLTDINDVNTLGDDYFALSLGYTTGTNPQYNGNIASMQWKTNLFGTNSYNYNYDKANRLTEAVFSETGNYNTSYEYDLNGNIKTLFRQGKLSGSSNYAMIDSLVYDYTGNQLTSVNDLTGDNYQHNGFSDNNYFSANEYGYDANGNMEYDYNKSILLTDYNHLNLPKQVKIFTELTNDILYLYDANGNKLKKVTRMDYTPLHSTDYIGSFVYRDGSLEYILTEEGRIVPNGNDFEYQYFLKDHLGNTRIMFGSDGTIFQNQAYYPFGMEMEGHVDNSNLTPENKYLYNGKEMQDEFGLDWYDYGARFYDPQIGRWHVVDNKAEKYSAFTPYAYAVNNPILFIDPDGNDILIHYKEKGKHYSYRFTGQTSKNTPNNKFVGQVIEAWNYNVQNGGGDPSFEAATNRDLSIPIYESDALNSSSEGTINWNPSKGSLTHNGTVLSPATILDHEFDHTVAFLKNPYESRSRTLKGNQTYDNDEEERVITGSEQKTAKANNEIKDGQVTRTNHKGTGVITYGVTSNNIDRRRTEEFYRHLQEQGYKLEKQKARYEKYTQH